MPNVEPFETMAESVTGYALEQEQRFPGVDVQLPGQVMIGGHCLYLAGPAGGVVSVVPHQVQEGRVFQQFRGEVWEKVTWNPCPHEGNGHLVQVANPFDSPCVGGAQGLDACLWRGGGFHAEDVGAEALAMFRGLLIQAARALHVPAEDRCCGYDAAAAALSPYEAEVGEAGQGLAYDTAGDAELLLEFLFRGQRRAGREPQIHDLPVQDVPDLGVEGSAFFAVQPAAASRRLRTCVC
jgi:hypothetical protein